MTRPERQYGVMRRVSGARPLLLLVLLIVVLVGAGARGQSTTAKPVVPAVPAVVATAPSSAAKSDAAATAIVAPSLPGMPAVQGTEIDRVVAIVNGELILDSDVDQERRFSALLPYGEGSGAYDRDAAVARLINRALILQQSRLQPGDEVSMEAAAKDLDSVRKSLPTCKEYHCETKAGWDRFLATEGFTEESLTKLWRERMEVLGFIELRFQMGVKISQKEIETYYEKTMLPQYTAQHVAAPPMKAIASRIQEVLLQQQVSSLLSDWLESLRAQGSVVVLQPGQGAP